MKLKSVIHYADTNSVEATWVEVVTPESTDAEGNVTPAVERQVRCHSYADVQMDDLAADLGDDAADYADLIALVKSKIVPYVPPPLTPADIVKAMEALFDATAKANHYDNRFTCALRAGYPGPFQAEGKAFGEWMDGCNALAYQMLAQVQAGTRQMPATKEEALALLPAMVWPA